MIDRFFNTTFTVLRMSWSGESSAEISKNSFTGHIQQARAELAEQLGLTFSKAFTIWCDNNADVEEGDTLNDGNYSYSVKAINKRDYNIGSGNEHLQLIIERDEDYISV